MANQETTAQRIVDFLASLHGIDVYIASEEEARRDAIDVLSGTVFRADPSFPDGEMLMVEYADGRLATLYAHKVVDALMLRHAQAQAVAAPDSGTVTKQYQTINRHYLLKTGADR